MKIDHMERILVACIMSLHLSTREKIASPLLHSLHDIISKEYGSIAAVLRAHQQSDAAITVHHLGGTEVSNESMRNDFWQFVGNS